MLRVLSVRLRPVDDDSGIHIDDRYIVYVVRSGDAPESIARRLCGSARHLEGRLKTVKQYPADCSPQSRFHVALLEALRAQSHKGLNPNRIQNFLEPSDCHSLVIALLIATNHLFAHA